MSAKVLLVIEDGTEYEEFAQAFLDPPFSVRGAHTAKEALDAIGAERPDALLLDMRFERTALHAHEHGFPMISSSLGISRWKDMNQSNGCGARAAARYPDLVYWDYNWRKGGGSQRMIEISKREQFYQQEYCGCVYSLRDTNAHRAAQGRKPIEIGVQFYGRDAGPQGQSDTAD